MEVSSIMPKRPKQFHNESMSGYLFRLFKSNHFMPNSNYLRELELTYAQLLNNEVSDEIFYRICPWNRKRDFTYMNNTKSILGVLNDSWCNKLIQKNNLKFCPLCIQENFYHQLEWCILPLKMCTKHFVILQEGCGTCSKPLDYFSFIQQSCIFCLSPLNRLSIDQIQCDIFSNSQLNLKKTLIFREKSVVFDLEANDYIELVFASIRFLDGFKDFTGFSQDNMDIFHNRKYKTKSSINLAIAFSNADWLYTNFPNHFYYVLDLFIAKYKGMKRYGAFQHFETVVKRDCFTEIRDAFHQYCIQKLESGIIRRDFGVFREEPKLLQKRKIIRREEVKIEKGVTYGKMFRLAKNNLVQMNQSKRNEYYIDQTTLDMYLKEEKRWITKKEAALILGIHAASLESLIRSDLFEVSLKYSGKSKRINLDEVKELVARCRGELVKSIPSDYISFHDALIKYTIFNLSIVSLIQLILSGVLIPVRQNSEVTLREIYLNNDKLYKCLIAHKERNLTEKGYFFSDLLKVFKIGEKRLHRLLKEHNILPDIVSHYKDGRARFLYKETSKKRIQEVLVTNKKIRD